MERNTRLWSIHDDEVKRGDDVEMCPNCEGEYVPGSVSAGLQNSEVSWEAIWVDGIGGVSVLASLPNPPR